MTTSKEVYLEDTERKTYSDVLYTVYCKQCGKEWSGVLSPYHLKKFLAGKIDSEQAFEGTVSDEDAFLIVFKVCTECNGGYELEEIECYPNS